MTDPRAIALLVRFVRDNPDVADDDPRLAGLLASWADQYLWLDREASMRAKCDAAVANL